MRPATAAERHEPREPFRGYLPAHVHLELLGRRGSQLHLRRVQTRRWQPRTQPWVEAVRDTAGEHERAGAQPFAAVPPDLDEPVAVADMVHSAARADRPTGLQDAGGQRPIKARPVEDGDLFARILELCHAAARLAYEARRSPVAHSFVGDFVWAVLSA